MKKIAIIILIGLSACHSHVDEITPDCKADSGNEMTYSGDVSHIIGTSCAIPDCHGEVDFEHGYFKKTEVVIEKAESGMLEFMIITDQMPHGATEGPSYLTDCEVKIIKNWINHGAKNN